MMEMVLTTGATRRAKLASNGHNNKPTRPDALSVAQPTVSKH